MIDFFLKYLQSEKRLSANTVVAYATDLRQFERFIIQTFPDYTIDQADFGIIRAWIVSLVEAKLDAASVNRKIACLRAYYKFLMRQGHISKDPMLKVRVLKVPRRLPSFAMESEMQKVLDSPHVFDFTGATEKLVLELFYGTGIRLSELINLREQNVDLDNRTIRVLGKRNKERVIPFTISLRKQIESYLEIRNRDVQVGDHGCLLVTEKGDPCYPMMIYRIVKENLQSTSASRKSPHVLRHTYATHLLDKGAEINAVKDLLGHSSLSATQVYTHNSIEKLKKAFDQAHPKA
ncbi:tyrosine-type recombinase/integrase [Pseudochryseolinea flava]|uniref:Tyrosine recombinase XerC n=1 Tax=Pseudochryseolinea flava TaxID=2059302 RepID=A0A364Y7K1_9BACT|nr:tyrosine-type recombinase/integrase [Pseudochryseolinea flava]RAW03094.1 integrase [Pseudochryseolinea flava]